jgi:hypothetical protein
MKYRSVGWRTDWDGKVKEIEVEYTQTFWQWLLKKPGTCRTWKIERDNNWYLVVGENRVQPLKKSREIRELADAQNYVHLCRYTEKFQYR